MKRRGRKSKTASEDTTNGLSEKSNLNGENVESEEKDEEPEEKKKKSGGRRGKGATKKPAQPDPEPEEAQYEVEQVLDQKNINGIRHYLIRWKGYEPESDTWEPESTLDCAELISDFKAKQKKKKNSKSPKSKPRKRTDTTDDEQAWDENEDFEVDRILDVYFKKNGQREFLVSWKGYPASQNSWEPEDNMDCKDLIKRFMEKVEQAKTYEQRELRVARTPTNRFTLFTDGHLGRRLSKRHQGKERVHYHDTE